jgi:hypothetical protein
MEHDIDLMTQDEFVRKILHRNHYVKYADDWKERLREPCLVIGHNLPFDLGAVAIHCGLAEKDLLMLFRPGFTPPRATALCRRSVAYYCSAAYTFRESHLMMRRVLSGASRYSSRHKAKTNHIGTYRNEPNCNRAPSIKQ